MRKLLLFLRMQYKVLLLLVCCSVAASSIGYLNGLRNGRNSLEAEYQKLAENYSKTCFVDLTFTGPDGQPASISSLSNGIVRISRGHINEKHRNVSFIERTSAPYDLGGVALTNGDASKGFDFTFPDSAAPDTIFVQCWPRQQQGTTGTFTNGEPVEVEADDLFTTFHAAHFRPGYIYSIYASWGPYYGEYGFLVSTQESDREYWTLLE